MFLGDSTLDQSHIIAKRPGLRLSVPGQGPFPYSGYICPVDGVGDIMARHLNEETGVSICLVLCGPFDVFTISHALVPQLPSMLSLPSLPFPRGGSQCFAPIH
jgi:hypothetical protein